MRHSIDGMRLAALEHPRNEMSSLLITRNAGPSQKALLLSIFIVVSIVSGKVGGFNRLQSQDSEFGARTRGTFSSPFFGFVSGAGVIFATPSRLPLCPVMMPLDMLEDAASLMLSSEKQKRKVLAELFVSRMTAEDKRACGNK